ncbi:MAG: sigma-54 dependent transcriptional regulator [Chitinivibrionales bacterium]|nr:sigma-54 dependent transcriptional regulator [Chitinivibrionales bacterium]
MAHVLIVDDESKMRELLAMAITAEGHTVTSAESAEAALKYLAQALPDVVITDVRMSGMSGLELLAVLKKKDAAVEVIVMTAFTDAKSGIEAMKNGALEYVAKPFEMDEMLMLVAAALEKRNLAAENVRLKEDLRNRYRFNAVLGTSKAMRRVIEQAGMVSKRDTTVLIRGKSGTGKELIARGIHAESGRSPWVTVNCGALPENLLESELFGYEKGAFTGANAQKIGFFEAAAQGTIFLDEIGDLTLSLQVKLLRVLQEHEFTRVGGTTVIKTGARVIAATNRNLEEALKEGSFREDLYYRLNVFPIFIPSLAERREDIGMLAETFCKKFEHTGGLSPAAMTILMEYAWPGNVRELENCIERAVIVAENKTIEPAHLPDHIGHNRSLMSPGVFRLPPTGISLDELEKNMVMQALERAQGNKTKAAALLGISRRALYSKMETHGIGKNLSDEAD